MVKRNYFAVILSVIMAFSGVCLYEMLAPQAVITAYASTLSTPQVTASNSSTTSVKLSWKKIKGTDKYIIYRSTNKSKGFKAVKTLKSSSNSYTDSKLTCGKAYYYKVYAVKGKSKSKAKTVKVTVAPPKPTSVKAQSQNCGTIKISYKAVKDVTGYEIYYSESKSGSYTLLGTTKKTSYSHNIGTGNTGYYKVKAYKTVSKKKIKSAYSSAVNTTALSHDYSSYVVDTPAGCATEGLKHTTCSRCGAVDKKIIEPTGEHAYSAYVVTTAPTCTSNGVETSTCRNCGKAVTKSIKAIGHSYTAQVIAPSCTQGGYTVSVCSNCADSFTSDFTNPTGHSYSGKTTKYPDCINKGEKLYTCSDCGKTYTKVIEPTGEHDYSVLEVVTEPTCTQDGEIKLHCSTEGCDAVNPNCTSISSTEHNIAYAYDEEHYGEHYMYCTECGQKIKFADGLTYNSCNSSYDVYEKDGVQYAVAKCLYCGFTSEEIEVATINSACTHDNVEENLESFPATCTTKGYTGFKMCFDCGMILDSGEEIEISGHSFEISEDAVAPSCTDTGKSAVEICSSCGERRGGVVSVEYLPTGHSYKETVIPATCVSEGYTVEKCEHCGIENMNTATDFIAKLGHSYGDYTTDENGYRVYTCAVCSDTETDTTCYIDLTARTVSVSSVAQFTKSTSGNDKLLLTYDGVSDYELTGSAENLIIDLDIPDVDINKVCDIKLSGVSITNNSLDIINIKNQRTDAQKPKASISAKFDTINSLTTITDGNAIDSDCGLELKGRGQLIISTASTSISCGAKLTVKNLTLDITSGKRGIDLEKSVGENSDYYNLELSGNAVITINSADDCIRCKNFEANKLDNDEIDSIVTLNSTAGDGIDAKGDNPDRKSVVLHSGTFTITAGKKLVNVDNKKGGVEFDNTPTVDGTATVNGNKFV